MATNIQSQSTGFGSYLVGILPDDVATAAGALSYSLQQVKNISQGPVEKLAAIAQNIETTKDLNSINGTSVPVDTTLARQGLLLIAKGNGPQETYTMSNFLGCMSGLPYNGSFKTILDDIKVLETPLLYWIYKNNYLAVTWEQATASISLAIYYTNHQAYVANAPNPNYPSIDPVNPYISCSTGLPTTNPCCQPRIDYWYYKIIGIQLTSAGGGYGREDAANPIVTITDYSGYDPPSGTGATASVSNIGRNDTHVPGDFGRVLGLILKNTGGPVKYAEATNAVNNDPTEQPALDHPPAITIEPPPGPGWPGMNIVIQNYINQANTEISRIQKVNTIKSIELTNAWLDTGIQLTFEQRARTIGLPALGPQTSTVTTRDTTYSAYPTIQYTFTDSLPGYAVNTLPHMYAQTIEAISNLNTVGGQSMVGLERENRNQDRLTQIGVSLDNNIPDKLSIPQQAALLLNGSLPLGDNNSTPPATLINKGPDSFVIQPPGLAPPGEIVAPAPFEFNGYSDLGSLAPNPYLQPVSPVPYNPPIPPTLNTVYTSNTLLPNTYDVNDAIDAVIKNNCDCWVTI